MSQRLSHSTNAAPFDISAVPLLDERQAGHIRHIQNLARQAPGDWSLVGGPDSWHSGGTLFKQLGALYWPLALAHYHLLPAAPCVFHDTSNRLIEKMRRVDVWGYWPEMSRSGPWYDHTLSGPREGWIDPVGRENIMFSGRLAVMAGLHSVLFDDSRYEASAGLSLTYPYPYAGGPRTFEYDLNSLNQTIYWQIVESGYLGVSCEPNMTFIVCNQYAIIGQRMNDIRRGTDTVTDLCRSYESAWEQKGWLNESGSLITFYKPTENRLCSRSYSTAWDAYALTFMNSWNQEMVRDLYPHNFGSVFRYGCDDTISIWPEALAEDVHRAKAAGQDPRAVIDHRWYQFSDSYYDLTFYLPFLSEVGDLELLNGLLAHADRYMSPTWKDGGLYYPRNDVSWDPEGNLTYMDPWCGNGSIAHARLNVKDGLRAIYQAPWGPDHFAEPNLARTSENVQVLRASFLRDCRALVLTLCSTAGDIPADLVIDHAGYGGGIWKLFCGAEIVARCSNTSVVSSSGVGVRWIGESLSVRLRLNEATNIVLIGGRA